MKCISPLLAVFLLLFSVLDATYGGDPIYGVFVFLVQQESDRVHVNCGEGTKSAECTALLWIQGVEGGSNHLDWNREQGQNDEALYTCHISKNIVVPGLQKIVLRMAITKGGLLPMVAIIPSLMN